MGNSNVVLGANQEVEHQSGLSRLCNSIIVAICVAPLLMIGACILLGWNEKRAVCSMRAIGEGKETVEQVGCASATSGNGELVMFNCDLSNEGLLALSPTGDFQSRISFVGAGLQTEVEMYQCVQTENRQTKKDSVGGGTTTIVTYTYSRQWSSTYINSWNFNSQAKMSSNYVTNCGGENPTWPSSLPAQGTQWNPSAKVGAFTVPSDLVHRIPLDTPVSASSIPTGWGSSGGYYTTRVGSQPNDIGQVRVRFFGNNWAKPTYCVLGQNNGGTIGSWTASDSWLCSGYTLVELRAGAKNLGELFSALEAEAEAITYVLRFVGFFIMWFAFSRLFGPLEVAADCIPCVGPYIGTGIEKIACCISCLPGCSCSLGIIGIVWVAMRPAVGIPLMIVFFCTCLGFVSFKIYSKQKKGQVDQGQVDQGQVVQGQVIQGQVVDQAYES